MPQWTVRTLSLIHICAGGIGAKQIVEENATDLAKYGFDKPTATVKMTFKDNKAEDITCLIGIKYEGENSWYVKTDKSDTVYLVANAGVSFAMNSELSYVNKSTLTAAEVYKRHASADIRAG